MASPTPAYRRDRVSWVAFAALLGFGVLNAGLGPALPYIRAAENISYLGGVLHQMAYAVGGGLAGLILARASGGPSRTAGVCAGLGGAAVAWLFIGYGRALAVTAGAAFFVSMLGTYALIRLWAVLADVHGPRRTVAMTEGEVSVSLGGILAPLLVGGLAATSLGWRSAFVVGAVIVAAGVAMIAAVGMPPAAEPVRAVRPAGAAPPRRLPPTLLTVLAIVGLEFSLAFWLASYLADDVGVARRLAVAMVSGLYVANLAGRLLASRLARATGDERILAGAIALALVGLPVLLAAGGAAVAGIGIALAGVGVGALFPLASSLHIGASGRDADSAMGQVLAIAAVGQVLGPLSVAAIAQAFDLRAGMVVAPALALLAGAGLRAHTRRR